MTKKRLLTLDDLMTFCETANISTFSAKDFGSELCVFVPATFAETDETDDDDDESTMFYGTVKMFHTGKNRNGSNVTDKAAENCLSGIAYKPFLANFCEIDGIKDFTSHDVEIYTDENGEEQCKYLEHQIGCFTAKKAYIKYDEKLKKNFVYAEVAIPKLYTDAYAIIKRKKGTKVSVELKINEMNYNAKERTLDLTDVEVLGCTALGVDPETGKPIGEGMLGSKLTIEDFSMKNNSIQRYSETDNKLIEVLTKLNATLDSFNDKNSNSKKGGETIVSKFEELLAKYSKTQADVTFEVEGLSDEELEQKFAEAFATEPTQTPSEPEQTATPAEPATAPTDANFAENTVEYTIKLNDSVKTFSLSLDEVQLALHRLVNNTYAEADDTYYSVDVYPDEAKVVMHNWGGSAYRQAYERAEDSFTLVGERVAVHQVWVSADEETKLAERNAQFEAMETQLAKYTKAEIEDKKKALLESDTYAVIADTEEVKNLVTNAETYSALTDGELEQKLDSIMLTYAKAGKLNFAETPSNTTGSAKKRLPVNNRPRNSRYGGIFRGCN